MADSTPSSANNTDFVITIDDTSPTLVYSPLADPFGTPNLTAGWNPFYSATGYTPDPATGQGNGVSLHVTSANNASSTVEQNARFGRSGNVALGEGGVPIRPMVNVALSPGSDSGSTTCELQ